MYEFMQNYSSSVVCCALTSSVFVFAPRLLSIDVILCLLLSPRRGSSRNHRALYFASHSRSHKPIKLTKDDLANPLTVIQKIYCFYIIWPLIFVIISMIGVINGPQEITVLDSALLATVTYLTVLNV